MKRTDSIVTVLVAKYATMYIEADTPEDAYKYAKKHCHKVYRDFKFTSRTLNELNQCAQELL